MKNYQRIKRASLDNMYILVSFFALVIVAILGQFIWSAMTDTEMQDNVWDKTSVGQNAKNTMDRYYASLDTIVIFVYIALHLGVLVLAFLLRSHPVVFVVTIFLAIIIAIMSPIFSNTYESIIQDQEFSDAAQMMPKVNYLMSMLPQMEIIWVFVTAIIMFGLSRTVM